MRRFVAAVVLASGVTLAIFLASGPGDVVPNRVVTCEATATPSLRQRAQASGYALAKHFQVRMGARRNALADGGVEFILPRGIADDIRVRDWNECDVDACATFPARCIQAEFDSAMPFVVAQPRCVRRKADAGANSCLLADGGRGDRPRCADGCNVYPALAFQQPLGAGCERVACSVASGESAREALGEGAP